MIILSSGWKEQHKRIPSGDRRFQNCSACEDNSLCYQLPCHCHQSLHIPGAFNHGNGKEQQNAPSPFCSSSAAAKAALVLVCSSEFLIHKKKKKQEPFFSFPVSWCVGIVSEGHAVMCSPPRLKNCNGKARTVRSGTAFIELMSQSTDPCFQD